MSCTCSWLFVHLSSLVSPPLSLCHYLSIPLSSKLNPKLTPADQFDVIKVSTDSVYPLPSPSAVPLNGGKKKQESVLVSLSIPSQYHIVNAFFIQNVDELQSLLDQAVAEVSSLLVTLLQKEYSSDNLESIFKVS